MSAKVYAFIHNFKMEEFFYGNERLMELFRCSEPTITRAISQLEKEGYISTRSDGRKRYITDNYFTQRVIKNDYPESSKVITPSEARESSTLITRNEASTAGVNKKEFNKKNLLEGNLEIPNDLDSIDPKTIKPKRRADRKKVLGGFSSPSENQSRKSGFPSYAPRKTGTIAPEDLL